MANNQPWTKTEKAVLGALGTVLVAGTSNTGRELVKGVLTTVLTGVIQLLKPFLR